MESRVDLSGVGSTYVKQPEGVPASGLFTSSEVCARHGTFSMPTSYLSSAPGRTLSKDSAPPDVLPWQRAPGAGLSAAGLTERLSEATFGNFVTVTDEQRKVLAKANEIADQWGASGAGGCGALLLFGGHNTGKTHLAMAIMNFLAASRSVHYADASLGTPVFPLETEVLVVDNVYYQGETTPNGVVEDLDHIIRCRAERGQRTVLVSDQEKGEFVRHLAAATLASLRARNALIMNLNWRIETHLLD